MIELKNITKTYDTGKVQVHALRDVSITIEEGDFVAIMGPSGSGKSTLLDIIGFLDQADTGTYHLLGNDITHLKDDELSLLRNHIAGFVFQQFHLLPRVSALRNVELPLIYAGKHGGGSAAHEKLAAVGLAEREDHHPNELSGGEQQRVAIARSLVNEPQIIFADEPTGNLDTRSEQEIISVLKKLNADGKTIVMVTHENEVAVHAKRIIRMRDGEVVSDERQDKPRRGAHKMIRQTQKLDLGLTEHSAVGKAEFFDYLHQAVDSIRSHKMRSFLSMLGILIGVAAVISMMAIGEGAKKSISQSLSDLGSNILTVMPGSRRHGGVSLQSGSITRMTMRDAKALARVVGVKHVSPTVRDRAQAVYNGKNWNTEAQGTGVDYPSMKSSQPVSGRFFNDEELRERSKVVLVGNTVVQNLFGSENPIGKTIKINRINFTIIGVLPVKGQAMFRDQDNVIIMPVTTAMYRLLGKEHIDSIDIEVTEAGMIDQVIDSAKAVIIKEHNLSADNTESFEIFNPAEIREALTSTTKTMSLLLGIVAAISLVVGGIGIMNIMLVSVKERVKEIGLRKAIGARRRDIRLQFLIESALLTFSGGIAGVVLGVAISLSISLIAGWAVFISPLTVFISCAFSIFIGIAFGLWPAVQAGELNPIEALRYE